MWTSWPVATLFWTPGKLLVKVRQAAGDVLAVQVIPERTREATCNLLVYHGEGQNRVATVCLSLVGGRGRCGLSADGGRPCPEVPRSVAVSGDAPSIRGDCHDSYICCAIGCEGERGRLLGERGDVSAAPQPSSREKK